MTSSACRHDSATFWLPDDPTATRTGTISRDPQSGAWRIDPQVLAVLAPPPAGPVSERRADGVAIVQQAPPTPETVVIQEVVVHGLTQCGEALTARCRHGSESVVIWGGHVLPRAPQIDGLRVRFADCTLPASGHALAAGAATVTTWTSSSRPDDAADGPVGLCIEWSAPVSLRVATEVYAPRIAALVALVRCSPTHYPTEVEVHHRGRWLPVIRPRDAGDPGQPRRLDTLDLEHFRRWIEQCEIVGTIPFLVTETDDFPLELQCAVLCQGLESLSKARGRLTKGARYRARVEDLATLVAAVAPELVQPGVATWACDIADVRNDESHEPGRQQLIEDADVSRYLCVETSARWVLRIALLQPVLDRQELTDRLLAWRAYHRSLCILEHEKPGISPGPHTAFIQRRAAAQKRG